MRKKDVVLLATVSSFEGLRHPGRMELRQFSELFPPLFAASTADARRQAVAALSQCDHVPESVQLFVATQPIDVAALYLIKARSISDQVLIEVARSEGEDHARAIARRDDLSPQVVDALVSLRHARNQPIMTPPVVYPVAKAASPVVQMPTEQDGEHDPRIMPRIEDSFPMQDEQKMEPRAEDETLASTELAAKLAREEQLRQSIKDLARHLHPPESDRLGLRHIQPVEIALLVRFARAHEIGHFTTALTYALSSTRWLAERILLDMSGQQLATTLVSLGMPDGDAAEVLTGIYPYLAARDGHGTKAESLLESLDRRECDHRVDSWLRADTYSFPSIEPVERRRVFGR